MTSVELILGDCLLKMQNIPDESIDAVICDPPFQITSCAWDVIIPFEPMWEQLKRITKPNSAIVLFGNQPFTSQLVMSNLNMFRYEWIWNKVKTSGFMSASHRPLKLHDNILVFSKKATKYNPQKVKRDKPFTRIRRASSLRSKSNPVTQIEYIDKPRVYTHWCPTSILTYSRIKGLKKTQHPTQKPVELGKYLVRTYTDAGDTVLDFCAGSGSFVVSAIEEGRNAIGIEKDPDFYDIMCERVKQAQEDMKRPHLQNLFRENNS